MSEGQELWRCKSVPVLNREDVVIKKVQEQDGLISLMQTQIEFQSEVISKHDKMFEDLLEKVHDLTSKVSELEKALSKRQETVTIDAERSALWTGNNSNEKATTAESKPSIADIVRETAEQTLGTESGFVYDEKLGLYFDQSSGYYYDPVKQLYYNGHTKTYYSYDAATNTYQAYSNSDSVKRKKGDKSKRSTKTKKVLKSSANKFHKEQAEEPQPMSPDVKVTKGSSIPPKEENFNDDSNSAPSPVKSKNASDTEEGELTSSNPTSAESSPRTLCDESYGSDDQSDPEDRQQRSYPPCIRAVVQSAPESPSLKKGTLFVVPYTGGTIGSNGSQHTILLHSPTVEKVHAKIHFDNATTVPDENQQGEGKYLITDLGSESGTFVNRVRLSEAGTPSGPCELVHGSTLQVGEVVLLLHMHPGDLTCGHCEPGLILQKDPMYAYTGENSESKRKSEMKNLKKKYGLDRKNENAKTTQPDKNYTDRARNRRVKVGSDNPFAKTEVTTTDTAIKESNKGFKMLKKMGWKGESLGNPQNEGIKEPISCDLRANRAGLGFENAGQLPTVEVSRESRNRSQKLAKTLERFKDACIKKEEDADF